MDLQTIVDLVQSHWILLISVAVSSVLVWVVMWLKLGRLKHDIEQRDQQIQSLDQHFSQLQHDYNETFAQLQSCDQDKRDLQAENGYLVVRLKEYETQQQEAREEYKALTGVHMQLKAKYSALQAHSNERERSLKDQLVLLQDNKASLVQEFENLSNKVLEQKSQSFKQTNAEAITRLLDPVQKELNDFKQKVDLIHTEETKQRTALKTELQQLQVLNKDITEQADRLSNALQGSKKMQGGWGEMILETVLDKSGLRRGQDYDREVTLTNEGERYRPDVVLYLPQEKHIVIDAKTSFNAYQTFVNSEDEAERHTALIAHTQAIRARMLELADKEYYKLEGLQSPEVVIMFIPIESAYVEALKADEALFQTALERNVLITTPTTLLTSLNIVKQLWRFEDQNKHTVELAQRAEKFHSKLSNFLSSMDMVGKTIDKARDTYDRAYKQLYSGKGNLIKQASDFKELGVAVQQELPAALVEQANLELDHGIDHEIDREIEHDHEIDHETKQRQEPPKLVSK